MRFVDTPVGCNRVLVSVDAAAVLAVVVVVLEATLLPTLLLLALVLVSHTLSRLLRRDGVLSGRGAVAASLLINGADDFLPVESTCSP